MNKPELVALSRIPWQVFGSLTFRQERLPERVRLGMWFSHIRVMASWYRIHFSKLVWVLRMEAGEIGGRLHFHYLLAGVPPWAETKEFCGMQSDLWSRIGGGFSAVRLYDARLSGADYIVGCLSGGAGRSDVRDAQNAYESSKFGFQTCELMLSENFRRVLRDRSRGNGMGRGTTEGDTIAVCESSKALRSAVMRGGARNEVAAVVGVESPRNAEQWTAWYKSAGGSVDKSDDESFNGEGL